MYVIVSAWIFLSLCLSEVHESKVYNLSELMLHKTLAARSVMSCVVVHVLYIYIFILF